MSLLKLSILLLAFLLLITCGHNGIRWNPDFWVSDYENGQIINEEGMTVSCNEPRFNDYACLSKDKIIELLNILRRYNLPREAHLQLNKIEEKILLRGD